MRSANSVVALVDAERRRRHAREGQHVPRGRASRGRRGVGSRGVLLGGGGGGWARRRWASSRWVCMAAAAASPSRARRAVDDGTVALGERGEVDAGALHGQVRAGERLEQRPLAGRASRCRRRRRSCRGRRRWRATARAGRPRAPRRRIASTQRVEAVEVGRRRCAAAARRAASASSAARTGNASQQLRAPRPRRTRAAAVGLVHRPGRAARGRAGPRAPAPGSCRAPARCGSRRGARPGA